MGTILLWALRKALYVSLGSGLAVLAAYVSSKVGGPDYQLGALTLTGALSGLFTAVVGDLRRAFAADFLQFASGDDPRKDG